MEPKRFASPPTGVTRITLDDDDRDYLDWRQGSGHTIEIYDLCVGSERRRGRGRALVNRLLRNLPSGTRMVWAITRGTNRIAQLFYEEMRFRIVGNLFDFYQDEGSNPRCVDAIMYGRDV